MEVLYGKRRGRIRRGVWKAYSRSEHLLTLPECFLADSIRLAPIGYYAGTERVTKFISVSCASQFVGDLSRMKGA